MKWHVYLLIFMAKVGCHASQQHQSSGKLIVSGRNICFLCVETKALVFCCVIVRGSLDCNAVN
jgi:hypothetical protein